jgi:RNA polymerase-binding transcription factor DksA
MDSDRARERLRRERERIEMALAGEAHAPDTDLATRDQHLGDQGTELYDDELAEGLREQLAAELAAVERAEARLARGKYGVSIESGEQIPDERLEAHPTAERTTEEQARLER